MKIIIKILSIILIIFILWKSLQINSYFFGFGVLINNFLLIGTFIHEIGHTVAGLLCGEKLIDFKVRPMESYVKISCINKTNKCIYAFAGPIASLIGYKILFYIFPVYHDFWFGIFFLGLIQIIPLKDCDGYYIFFKRDGE